MSDGRADHTFDMSNEAAHKLGLARVLAWYREMGVDIAVGAESVDWFAKGQEPPVRFSVAEPPAALTGQSAERTGQRQTPGRRQSPVQSTHSLPASRGPVAAPSVTMSDEAAEANAREAARQARSLDELHELLRSFDGCGLKKTAKNLCFYRGAIDGRVMIIGEAPGADEDRSGIPFVGRAGRLLDKMLAAISLGEAETHITNVVYWRPPGNRVPTPQETMICRPFLERQIRLVEPELIVTVGGAAAKLILGVTQGIMRTRGKWGAIDVPGEEGEAAMSVPVMPTLHPAYLLRSPAHKRHAWRDLLAIRTRLDGGG